MQAPQHPLPCFLDLEAAVDDDERDDEEEEGLEDQTFIDDSDVELASNSRSLRHIPELKDDTGSLIRRIEEKYVMREPQLRQEHNMNTSAVTMVEKLQFNRNFPHRPRRGEDWPLWRVKCKPGQEFRIVCDLMRRDDVHQELRSAFYNPNSVGYVYLEAKFLQRQRPLPYLEALSHPLLREILYQRSDIRKGSIIAVAEDDLAQTLFVQDEPIYRRGQWVSIQNGLYKGDVGIVVEDPNEDVDGVCIMVVPRIHYQVFEGRKRKRVQKKAEPVLFSASLVSPEYRFRLTALEDHLNDAYCKKAYNYEGVGQFSYGLTFVVLNSRFLTPAQHIPPILRKRFYQSGHPAIHDFPMPSEDLWVFSKGEPVYFRSHKGERVYGKVEVDMEGTDGLCEVKCMIDGVSAMVYKPVQTICKLFEPGESVESRLLPDCNGIVVAKRGSLVGFIENLRNLKVTWAQANTLRLCDSTSLTQTVDIPARLAAHIDCPWKGVIVIVIRGPYKQRIGEVKRVWRDKQARIRILVELDLEDCYWELDYFDVVDARTDMFLQQAYPLEPKHQQQFSVKVGHAEMFTGSIPWTRAHVLVIRGQFKGSHGFVTNVSTYQVHEPTGSGVMLEVELQTIAGNVSLAKRQIDYDDVRDKSTLRPLADVFPCIGRQIFFLPQANYVPGAEPPMEDPATQYHYSTADNLPPPRSKTPPVTAYEREFVFVGEWSPRDIDFAEVLLPREDPPPFSPPLSPPLVIPTRTQQDHWIFHPKLKGIAMRVQIQGVGKSVDSTKKGKFVKTVDGLAGDLVITLEPPDRKHDFPIPHINVFKHPDRPNPRTDKHRMVVIGGEDRDIGKLVRPLHYLFKGPKEQGDIWFIMAVMDCTGSYEVMTSETLEVSADDVEHTKDQGNFQAVTAQMQDIRALYRSYGVGNRPPIQ